MEIPKINSGNMFILTNYPEKNNNVKAESTSHGQEIKRSAIFDIVIDPLAKADPNETYLEKMLRGKMQDESKEQEKQESVANLPPSYIDKIKIDMEEKMQKDANKNAEDQDSTKEETQLSHAQISIDSATQVKTDMKVESLSNTNSQITNVDNNLETTKNTSKLSKNTDSSSINIMV